MPFYTHRYHYCFGLGSDGDYVVLMSWTDHSDTEGSWTEHTRWLIPGTQLEDE